MDLSNVETIASFVGRYGRLTSDFIEPLHGIYRMTSRLPGSMWEHASTGPSDQLSHELEAEGERLRRTLDHTQDQIDQRTLELVNDRALEQTSAASSFRGSTVTWPAGCTSVDEFRTAARLLRDLVRVWRGLKGWTEWEDVCAQWESVFRPQTEGGLLWPTPEQGALLLASVLNEGLMQFHVRLGLLSEEPLNLQAAPTPSLWSALCLQFTNNIIENVRDPRRGVIKECQNESCRNLFVRQEDPKDYGQNRSRGEIKYCSAKCVRTAKQRRYRKSKRDKES